MDMIYDTGAQQKVSNEEVVGMIHEMDMIYVISAAKRRSMREKS